MRTLNYLDLVLVGAMLLLPCGCRGERKEGLAPVKGQITYGGQPVPAGQVFFYPADGGRRSSGTIDQGKYVLTSYKPGDGALIGKHKVVIDGTEIPAPPPDIDAPGETTVAVFKPPKRIVPEEYYDQAKTPLEAEVKDEDNVINFDIPK
jgi:hypothetical protein